jgi:hypothetical protein
MGMWLYQLNQKSWPPNIFRYEIWENHRWHWPYGQKRGNEEPGVGDILVFFYAPAAGDNPGIYAWAVIERCDADDQTLYFIPTSPTNHLKMDPWWGEDVKKIADEIRGGMKQATLFPVPEGLVPKIRVGIKKWLTANA